jgi:hypothetical protein
MAEIRWNHTSHRLILPVAVLPSAAAENAHAIEVVDALIDTGATGTGLRPDIAATLGVLGRGKRRVVTANGDMLVPEYRIRIGFYCGTFEGLPRAEGSPYVLEFGLLVHALRDHFAYPMLIGMDVLSSCDLHLRRDQSVVLSLP